VKLRSN